MSKILISLFYTKLLRLFFYLSNTITVHYNPYGGNGEISIMLDCYVSVNFTSAPTRTWQRTMVQKDHRRDKNVRSSSSKMSVVRFKPKSVRIDEFSENSKHEITRTWKSVQWKSRCSVRTQGVTKLKAALRALPTAPPKETEDRTRQYLLTPWSRVLLEKLTSKLCS
jgi:hypothetical protein